MDNKRYFRYLACWASILALLGASALTLEARTRKGDRYFKEGRSAESQRDYLKAYELYGQALNEDPVDSRYQLAYERTRFRAAQSHLKRGQDHRREGNFTDALASLEEALLVDPSLEIARQEIKEVKELIEKEKSRSENPDAASVEIPTKTDEELAEARRRQLLESLQGPPDLKPISRKPINLVINNQPPKVIFETIAKLAGVNVLFDPAFLSQQGTNRRDVQLVNASLEQALDYAALITKAFWKPVTDNAIFIAADDANKRREYTDWVAKVFYLRNINGAQDLTEIANNIRQVTNSRFLFPVPSQNALVVRAERDQVLLIEKLVNDLDKSKPEVVVDVMVFEASRNKTRNIVASFLSGSTNGLSIPFTFTPRGSTVSGGDDDETPSSNTIPLNRITRLSTKDFSVSLPNAVFSALMSDANTKFIQSPQIRALDGLEATLKVGSRVPIAQGAFSSGIGGGTTGLPFANTQFSFEQVGTEVTITPRVMGEDDVYLKMRIIISSVLERIDVGGVQQPVIGNREITHEVRLRAGEVNLIGGLLSQEDSRTLSGTPGLANIPVLGRLFSGENVIRRDQDVFIALVPRIIRKYEVDPENSRMISTGTDQVIKLTYTAPQTQVADPATANEGSALASPFVALPATPAAGAATETTQASDTTVATTTAPARGGSTRGESTRGASGADGQRGASGNMVAGQNVGLPEITRSTGRGIPAGSSAVLRFNPPGLVTQSGSTFSLVLDSQGLENLRDGSFDIVYSSSVLRYREARQGSLLTAQGQRYTFNAEPQQDGRLRVMIALAEGQEAVSGAGSIAVLQFEAIGSGTSPVRVEGLALRNAEGAPLVQAAPSATIRVQ